VGSHRTLYSHLNVHDLKPLQVKFYLLDGGAEYFETMAESGEPPIPSFSWIVGHTKGRAPYTMGEMFRLNAEREKFRARAHAHWNASALRTKSGRPVDAILTPIAPTLAAPHDTVRWWGYSSYWNLLDYPAAVFPTGQFRASEWDGPLRDALPKSRNETEEFIREQWDPKTYDNTPIALQVFQSSLSHFFD
jgi:amidase